jgi:hypothetical protein
VPKRAYRHRLALLAATLALLAAAFVGGEWLVQRAAPARCRPLQSERRSIEFNLQHLSPCMRRERLDGAVRLVPGDRGGARGGDPPVPLARTPGVVRIALLGESTGDLVGQSIRALIGRPSPTQRYEFLDCSDRGSALEHLERRFDEVVGYAPDAVIVVFGHNLTFRMETDEAQLRLRRLTTSSCLLAQLTDLVRAPPPATEPFALAGRLARFEGFIRRAAREARARRVALIATTMASNVRLPPEFDPRDADDEGLLEARFLDAAGRPAEAIGALERRLGSSDRALFHHVLGQWLGRAGDAGRAYEELHRALDGDAVITRAPRRYNDRLRALAAEERFTLRDTERVFEAAAPDRSPGWESFTDNCHPRRHLLEREARALVDLARAAAGAPPDDREPPPGFGADAGADGLATLAGIWNLSTNPYVPMPRWYLGLAGAVQHLLGRDPAAPAAIAGFLAGGPVAGAPAERRRPLLVAVAEGHQRAGDWAGALALNARARAEGGAEGDCQAGRFHLMRRAPAEARAAFARCLAADPESAEAGYFLRRLDAGPPAPPPSP